MLLKNYKIIEEIEKSVILPRGFFFCDRILEHGKTYLFWKHKCETKGPMIKYWLLKKMFKNDQKALKNKKFVMDFFKLVL